MRLEPRETVILAERFDALVDWYAEALGFRVTARHTEDYHYCNLETDSGIRIGIADAKEMGVEPQDRSKNTVVLQFGVEDVKAFFEHLRKTGGAVTFGPSFSEKGEFWFGGFNDPEGNPCWVVDLKCP